MNKIQRNGVNTEVAWLSSLNCLRTNDPISNQEISRGFKKRGKSIGFAAKKAALPFFRLAFRFVKPFLRPITHRVRHHFTAGLSQQLSTIQTIQENTILTVEEAKIAIGSLKLEQQILAAELENFRRMSRIEFKKMEEYSFAIARRIAIPCGQDEILIKTAFGFILCPNSDHFMLACLIETGELELGTRNLIQRLLKHHTIFVDVGANIGLHTIAAAKVLQGKGKVIAFEPFAHSAQLLEKSVWMNGFSNTVEIHQTAISNVNGKQTLFLGKMSSRHSLFPLDTSEEKLTNQVEVTVVRLDDAIPLEQKVDLIKIDVEGAELDVIEGGKLVIKNNPEIALIVEFGPSHLKRMSRTTEQWFKVFADLGLEYKAINSITGEFEDLSLEEISNSESINLFFARPNSSAWEKAKP